MLSGCDNHYTTETTDDKGEKLLPCQLSVRVVTPCQTAAKNSAHFGVLVHSILTWNADIDLFQHVLSFSH